MKHLLRRSEPAPTSLFTILPRLTLTYSFKPRPQRTFDSDQLTVATSTGNWHQVPRHSTKLRRRKTTSKTIRYPDDAKRNKKKNPISYLARNHLVSKKDSVHGCPLPTSAKFGHNGRNKTKNAHARGRLEAGYGGKSLARRSGCGTLLLPGHVMAWRCDASLSVHSIQAAVFACERTVTLQAGVDVASFASFLLSSSIPSTPRWLRCSPATQGYHYY